MRQVTVDHVLISYSASIKSESLLIGCRNSERRLAKVDI